MLFSICMFAVIVCLLGHATVSLATGKTRHSLETHVMATGVGLAAFAVAAVLLNTIGAPLTWWAFIAAGAVLELLAELRCRLKKSAVLPPEPFCTRSDIPLGVAGVLAAVTLVVFLHGSFAAPWLDDDDSWEHASSAKYIAVNHTYSIAPKDREGLYSYLEPYPPAYPVLMGVMNQLNPSMSWTLKFFTSLLVALSLLYFYVMAKEFTGKPSTALWMTGVLWIIPCFMSHFTWAQTLALLLFFPAFHALERSRREPAWAAVAAVCIAGIALAQPSAAAIFGIMAAAYWVVNLVYAWWGRSGRFPMRPVAHQAIAAVAGVVVAAGFYLPTYLKFGHAEFFRGITKDPSGTLSLNLAGTAFGQTYGLWDFIWSPAFQNKINQPTGIGLVLFFVVCAGVALLAARPGRLKENRWQVAALLWLVITVLGVESNYLPVTLFPHRFWAFLAIPAAMLAGEFLAWSASSLDWKNASVASALGLALGGALVFGGAAESINAAAEHLPDYVQDVPGAMQTTLLVACILLSAAGAWVLVYRLVTNNARGGAWAAGLALPVVIAGIVVTGGYGKASLQGFTAWPPGVRFYTAPVTLADGRQVWSRERGPEMTGYLELRNGFPPDSAVLSVNGNDDHPIGFDMFARPYDPEIRQLRKKVLETAPSELNAGILAEVVKLAREKGFDWLLVDHYLAAEYQFELGRNQRAMVALAQQANISEARFDEIVVREGRPTEAEKPFVEKLREALRRVQSWQEKERREMDRARRLRELMEESPELEPRPVLDTGPAGIVVFQLTYKGR